MNFSLVIDTFDGVLNILFKTHYTERIIIAENFAIEKQTFCCEERKM